MTRAVLGFLLSGGVLCVGFATSWIVCVNHARGRELDRLQRACEEAYAVRARLRAEVDAHVPGRLDPPYEPLLLAPATNDHELGVAPEPRGGTL